MAQATTSEKKALEPGWGMAGCEDLEVDLEVGGESEDGVALINGGLVLDLGLRVERLGVAVVAEIEPRARPAEARTLELRVPEVGENVGKLVDNALGLVVGDDEREGAGEGGGRVAAPNGIDPEREITGRRRRKINTDAQRNNAHRLVGFESVSCAERVTEIVGGERAIVEVADDGEPSGTGGVGLENGGHESGDTKSTEKEKTQRWLKPK